MEIRRLDTGPIFISLWKLGDENREGIARVNVDAIASYEHHVLFGLTRPEVNCTAVSLLGGNTIMVRETVKEIDELIWRAGPMMVMKEAIGGHNAKPIQDKASSR